MGDTMPTVPPIQVAGQDYLRKKRTSPTVTGKSPGPRPPRTAGTAPAVAPEDKIDFGKVASALVPGYLRPSTYREDPAAKRTRESDEAHSTAAAKRPEAQPDNTPVTTPTSSGASGPTRPSSMDVKAPWAEGIPLTEAGEPDVERFGEQGKVTVHATPGGDPAFKPGGFAHPGARKAGYRAAEDERIAALPERGETTYGPESVTGGHSWTLRTPSRQEARYDASRYRRAVEARQSSEDAAISRMDAQAAAAAAGISRSKALEGDPFAPEKASVAEAVGEQRAKAQPRMRGMEMAGQLLTTYNQAKLAIQNDPTLDDATKAQRIDQAQREFYMAMTGIAGRDVSPRHEPSMFGVLPPDEDA